MTPVRWLVSALLGVGLAGAACAQPVPRYRLLNRVAGFSVDLPLDYEVSTGGLRQTNLGINASNYGSLSTPQYGFFHCKPAPQEGAGVIARFVGAAYSGAEVKVSAGPGAGEWHVAASAATDLMGPCVAHWFVRPGQKLNYGVSFVAKLPSFEQNRAEIIAVLDSFRQIDRLALRVVRDRTENAYRVTMPAGWSHQGRVYRSAICPGWAVWQAQSPDGRSGCFEMPPGQATVQFMPVADIAGTYLQQGIQKEVPTVQNLRVERLTSLPRGAAAIIEMIKSFGGASLTEPRGEKYLVDYLGTVNGQPVRLRVYTTSYYIPFYGRPDLPGNFNWFIWGLWAPVDGWEEASSLAHSVHGTLEYDRQWLAAQRKAVAGVLGTRRKAYEKYNKEWMDHIAGNQDGGPDPDHPGDNVPDGPEGEDCYRHDDTGEYRYSQNGQPPGPTPPWRKVAPKKQG